MKSGSAADAGTNVHARKTRKQFTPAIKKAEITILNTNSSNFWSY